MRQSLAHFLEHGVSQEKTPASTLMELAAKVVLQEALEAEQRDAVGRERYQRGSQGRMRNGYRPGAVASAEGRVEVAVPQVRGIAGYRSTLMDFLSGHSEVLEKLVQEMYARGLSCRDIEDAFTDATGQCLLSRSGVSEVTQTLWQEYERFCERDLSGYQVLSFFVDAVYESLRMQAGPKEAILCAWGICEDGQKVLLHLALGNKESHADWLDFLRGMVKRGLRTPLTMTSDGAPGLIRALQDVFPQSVRIRCWMHKMQNVLDKLPMTARAEVKLWLQQVRDAPTLAMGQQSAKALMERYEGSYPTAIRSFRDDLDASLAHLRLPPAFRRCVRTTNLIERGFGEERRRTKTVPRFFDERSCLKLAFAALTRSARRWRRVIISTEDALCLAQLRAELQPPSPDASVTMPDHEDTCA